MKGMKKKMINNLANGIQEIGDKSYSIFDGCPNNCQYPCWARLIRRKKEDEWKNPVFNEKWFNQDVSKYYPNGIFVFGLHDIYPENLELCETFILRIVTESENIVKIVTKANNYCIWHLSKNLRTYEDRIHFIITITSIDDILLKEYEPDAPPFCERFGALLLLNYFTNYKISVLIEPFLDKNPIPLIKLLNPYIRNDIILGCMSNRNYQYHNKEDLKIIMSDISLLNDTIQQKIKYKSSFRDKLNGKNRSKHTENRRIRTGINKSAKCSK